MLEWQQQRQPCHTAEYGRPSSAEGDHAEHCWRWSHQQGLALGVAALRVAALRVSALRVAALKVAALRVAALRVTAFRVAAQREAAFRVAAFKVAAFRVAAFRVAVLRVAAGFVCSNNYSLIWILDIITQKNKIIIFYNNIHFISKSNQIINLR